MEPQLFTEKIEKIISRQYKKRIDALPIEEKKEINSIRKKIKEMKKKCQKSN